MHLRKLRGFLAAVAAIVGAACAQAPAPGGWIQHSDPQGYSLEMPKGWKAAADPQWGRVELRGGRGEQVVIWPVFLASKLEARSASAVLRKLAAHAGFGGEWSQPQALGPVTLRMRGPAGDRVALLTWTPTPKGAAACLYAASAPAAVFRAGDADLARIFASFRARGGGGPGKEPALAWTRWSDPQENAWSLEVPAQWGVSGGLFRYAPVDVRSAWEVVSPDGQVRVTGGDAALPPFTEPNQMLAMTGFPEGSWYSPGYGVRMLVRRYTPGVAFAQEYAATRGARGCAGAQITGRRERPEAVSAINAIYSRYGGLGMGVYLTAGEVSFACQGQGRPMRGYYFAATQRVQAAGMPGGVWNAEYLFGYLAAEDQEPLAQTVLGHILGSIQINPQWAAMQQNIAANTSQIVSRTHAEISDILSSTFANISRTGDEIARRRSNAILGVEDAIDPATGRELKVESGANYYWIDHRGAIVGTQTDSRPNLDFRELIRLP